MVAMLAIALLWSCNPSNSASDDSQAANVNAATDSHTSQTSLDVGGTYKGILPCADCSGIETELSLTDGNGYILKMTYLGKEPTKTVEKTGTYTWDASGNTIVLGGLDTNTPRVYGIGEGRLTQFDLSGNEITGNLADKYVLVKI